MKNSIITIIMIFLFGITAYSQSFDQGQILLFGSSRAKITFSDGTPWKLEGGAAYFIKDNICLGGHLGIAGASGETDIYINPFARYYFLEKYYGGVTAIKGFGTDGKTKYYAQVEAGYIYALNDYIAIEPNLKYVVVDGADLVVGVNISLYIGD